MKILITGNMGYVGPVVVERLSHSFPDADLIGLDIGYFAHCLVSNKPLPESRLSQQIFLDVRKIDETVFDGVDVIIHLAAISNDPMGNAYESLTYEINRESSLKIAEIAKRRGVKKFIFASSCSVYGYAEGGARIESDSLNPLTAYAKSKIEVEQKLEKLSSGEFNVTALRFATACGASPRLRLDLVLNDFVASAMMHKKIDILSDGKPWRPLINVKDMARAICWAIERNQVADSDVFLAINVGSNEWNYQVSDLAEAVCEIVPQTSVFINKDAIPDKRSYKVSFDKFKSMAPLHQPELTLNETIRQLAESFENITYRTENFRESDIFIRLKTLNNLKDKGFLNSNLEWTN
jgi:nucleoside-diphosphate-sugar epimerase